MTLPILDVELPYPPSTNHYWRQFRGRAIISREGRLYRQRVHDILLAKIDRPADGPLTCTIALRPPDRRRRDLDNTLKPMLDALQHASVYEDDSQIKDLRVFWSGGPLPGGSCRVMLDIWRLDDALDTQDHDPA